MNAYASWSTSSESRHAGTFRSVRSSVCIHALYIEKHRLLCKHAAAASAVRVAELVRYAAVVVEACPVTCSQSIAHAIVLALAAALHRSSHECVLC
jgi:hypothetical protein